MAHLLWFHFYATVTATFISRLQHDTWTLAVKAMDMPGAAQHLRHHLAAKAMDMPGAAQHLDSA
eukprot:1145047-Pelagomonas_calceolata.AAC.1